MITRDRVLSILRMKGPCLPVHIKKGLGEGDTFMIGAILTELREAGKVRVSHTKRGGSPFYYIPEHAHRLVDLIPDLGEKDRRTAQLLKQERVLRDRGQEPLTRVSLRQIKDFSVPMEVKTKMGTEIFWKFYSVKREEAESIVKNMLGFATPPSEQPKPNAPTPTPATQETPKPQPTKAAAPEKPQGIPAQELKKQDDTGDKFLKKILDYFADKRITIIEKEVLRKNSDIEFEIHMPTAVGRVEYFCKAKNKKKCNDGDLSSAYLKGQNKRLPTLFLTTGVVTKKAKEKIKTDFKGLVLKEL